MNELDIARYFIAMLYLAMNGKIEISFQSSMNNNNNSDVGNINDDKSQLHQATNFESIKISVANN